MSSSPGHLSVAQLRMTFFRSPESGSFESLATAPGNTYGIDDLNGRITFRIQTRNGNSKVDTSSDIPITPGDAGFGNLNTYSNTAPSTLNMKSDLVSGGTYYRHKYEADSQGFNRIS